MRRDFLGANAATSYLAQVQAHIGAVGTQLAPRGRDKSKKGPCIMHRPLLGSKSVDQAVFAGISPTNSMIETGALSPRRGPILMMRV